MNDNGRLELPPAPPCLVRHAINALHGQSPAMQLAALSAAAAWIITQRLPEPEHAPALQRVAQRVTSHAALLAAQTPRRG